VSDDVDNDVRATDSHESTDLRAAKDEALRHEARLAIEVLRNSTTYSRGDSEASEAEHLRDEMLFQAADLISQLLARVSGTAQGATSGGASAAPVSQPETRQEPPLEISLEKHRAELEKMLLERSFQLRLEYAQLVGGLVELQKVCRSLAAHRQDLAVRSTLAKMRNERLTMQLRVAGVDEILRAVGDHGNKVMQRTRDFVSRFPEAFPELSKDPAAAAQLGAVAANREAYTAQELREKLQPGAHAAERAVTGSDESARDAARANAEVEGLALDSEPVPATATAPEPDSSPDLDPRTAPTATASGILLP